MKDLSLKVGEEGKLELDLKGGDYPLLDGLINRTRDFERAMIRRYIRDVAGAQSNSLAQKALEMIAKEVENGKHVEHYMKRVRSESEPHE